MAQVVFETMWVLAIHSVSTLTNIEATAGMPIMLDVALMLVASTATATGACVSVLKMFVVQVSSQVLL